MAASSTVALPRQPRRLWLVVLLAALAVLVAALTVLCVVLWQTGWTASAPFPAPGVVSPAAESEPDAVIYVVGTEADREALETFTAQVNQDRLHRGQAPLADEVIAPDGDDTSAEKRAGFLIVWQAGLGRDVRVADLRQPPSSITGAPH